MKKLTVLPGPDGLPGQPQPRQRILDWLPWEKLLIWGLFILTVYTLRHFFFIIFVTFILSYSMRSGVRRISGFILGDRENIWLERALTLAGFVLLLFGLYGVGNYLGPALYRQGQALVQRVTTIDPEKELNTFMTRTVGVVLFHRTYSTKEDEKYQAKFEEFQQKQGAGTQAFGTFPDLVASLDKLFDADERFKIRSRLVDRSKSTEKEFHEWFLAEKAPRILEKNREKHISDWEKRYADAAEFAGLPPLEQFKAQPNYEHERDARIRDTILRDMTKNAPEHDAYRKEWEAYLEDSALANLKISPKYEERFREFYERLRKGEIPAVALPEGKPPYEYAKYVELRAAHSRGEEAFKAALADTTPISEDERLALARAAFEESESNRLAQDWIKGPTYVQVREFVSSSIKNGLDSMGGWIRSAVGYLLNIPIQLALSLLLSFFITLDIPRLRKGIMGLRESRVRDFFEEIAPGLYNFGRLIGRAFQAQGVIALFNTLLTFLAIRFLQIQNETVLCAVVFVCSFIPVLGVVLSSVPIAIMAIVQPGGSIILALEAILAILIIHFIETSVLNPKILGEMLHLHPVLVLAVLAIGEHFVGVWGLLLAVPVTVFIIRSVILNEEIPGLIEHDPLAKILQLNGPKTPPTQSVPPPQDQAPVAAS